MSKPLEGRVIRPAGDPSAAINVMTDIVAFLNDHGEDLTFDEHVAMVERVPLMEGVPADLWWERYVR